VPFHCFASTGNPALIALYDSAGGEIVRRYYRMGIELDEDVVPTTAPDDVEIRGVTEDDLPVVHTVMESAFRGQFGHEPRDFSQWRHLTIDGVNPDLGLWWLASVDGAPASALYGFAAPGTGYVDSLGTLRDFRGRGLGAALLRTSFAEFRRRGLPKASLAVDAANPTGALDLYTSVGMAVEHEDLRYSFPA
jgi:ribosomal protein S18 acetylase RimI-like enzyme